MSIEKRKTGYSVRWRDSAGKQHSQQVTLHRDALALDGELKRKQRMGELITHEKGQMRLADFWLLWLERYGQTHLTPRSIENYSALWSKHVEKRIGSTRLRALGPEDVAKLTAKLCETLSSSSVRKVLAVLQGILQRAVEWGYISNNPAARARKPRLVTREGVALTAEQVEALCKELDLRSETIVRVLAGTGLRPGELRGLTWADVCGESVQVTKAVSGNVVGPTKTNRRRSVVLRPGVAAVLQEWFLACGRPMPGVLVFPAVSGREVWTDQGWRMWQRQVFAPAAARAGFKGLVPYDLRHTFVSTLIAEGRDVYWIARQAGHSPTMTLTTYGHLFESSYQQASAPDVRRPAVQGLNP